MTTTPGETTALLEQIYQILPTLQGWCSPDKAACLVRHIIAERPAVLVELGVFGGSSLIPQLLAIRQNGIGYAHGVDPWRIDAALENMQAPANRDWWSALDMTAIYDGLVNALDAYGLSTLCTLHKCKSEEAVSKFDNGSIGLLHIDGNHSEPQSYADATLWLPKLKPGGILFFDDMWWTDGGQDPTTRKAIVFLLEHCERIELVGDCMVLRKLPD
jgi:predicted O-methyltransferase YrrM